MSVMFDKDAVEEPFHQPMTPQVASDRYLVRLLRLIFFLRQITLDEFMRLYQTHGISSNWSSDEIRVRHQNDRKALLNPSKLTIYLFNRVVYSVLGMDVVGLAVIARDPLTGRNVRYSSIDPID